LLVVGIRPTPYDFEQINTSLSVYCEGRLHSITSHSPRTKVVTDIINDIGNVIITGIFP